MPPKKRKVIGKISTEVKRKRLAKENETPEQAPQRRAADRSRASTSRKRAFQDLEKAAFAYNAEINYHEHPTVWIGKMEKVCVHCQAYKWNGEAPAMCCSNGKVKLPLINPPPEPLYTLMAGTTPDSKHFLQNIRKYNSCFQMTSFGATKEIREPGFMSTFKIQGQIYHRLGSLLPGSTDEAKFLQIFFMGDQHAEARRRCSNIPATKQHIVLALQQFLHEHNSYVNLFKTALERVPRDDYQIIIKADKTPVGAHPRTFNAPTIDEVAIVIVGNEFESRDIVLQKRNSGLQRVAETHRSYDALQYPIMFWQGNDGYNFGISQINPITGDPLPGKKVSAMDFYAFRLMRRVEDENHLLKSRQLLHQFVVDMYAKIESERLLYIRMNQQKLRVDDYIHLRDAMANDVNPNELGRMLILPATFTGGPRYMHEYTQDAMSYVRSYGRPDLFITFTCNPIWSEIQEPLLPGQKAMDRHDLIARVFKRKITKLKDVVNKCHIFGETRCWMYSIEWQKRGLPHAHFLIWLRERIRPTDIDKVISAEVPDPERDPLLFQIITKNMIHGPCGALNLNAPCMVNGECSKKYPRTMLKETQTGRDGYPLYRRRKPGDGGFTTTLKVCHVDVNVDNGWVVPYSPMLSKMFQAHINVESCQSVKAIKYICKYVNKGSDQAIFGLGQKTNDEISTFQLGRYISSNEAIWRILSFPIHEHYPSVQHLSVHLENGQRVYYNPDNLPANNLQQPPRTTLTEFFELCKTDVFARTLFYCDLPRYYTWNASSKKWQRRKQGADVAGHPGVKSSETLGRVYIIHPSSGDCFYLRMLLHIIKGPTSFDDLKIFNGQICATFQEACQKRGMLENDDHWDLAMTEAKITHSATRLRHLFAILLSTLSVSNPLQLWEKYKEDLSEDILMRVRRENPNLDIEFSPDIYNQTLIHLEDLCLSMSGKHLRQCSLPLSPQRNNTNNLSHEIMRERNYDVSELQSYIAEKEPLLNPEQRQAYNKIQQLINNGIGGICFLDAPGGTGKTFLLNLVLAKVRQQKKIAVAVASSGIAATLLNGGRTAHAVFKLPLNLNHNESPVCNIAKGTGPAKVLQECSLIVWDECTMAHKRALQAVNMTLKDLRGNQRLMGNVVVLLAGDFRQTLPVVPRSTPADELNACLKLSTLWTKVQKISLTTNMRVQLQNDSTLQSFSHQLLQLGDGSIPVNPATGRITFPNGFCQLLNSVEELAEKVFPNIQQNHRNHEWLCERAILAPKNDIVNKMNETIQNLLPGDSKSYKSVDTVTDIAQTVHYPIEFLNSLDIPGVPPHNLTLKVGTPIMLLRNLDTPRLCNGTRLCTKKLHNNIIEATILTGCAKGKDVFIPRVQIITEEMPFSFKRIQFPIRLAFAMTINKSQGQSLAVTGVNLLEPCFSHGQLYVACSRVGNPANLYIYTPDGQTKNIVYPQAIA